MSRPVHQPQPQQANAPQLQQEAARLAQAVRPAPLAVVRGASVNFGSS